MFLCLCVFETVLTCMYFLVLMLSMQEKKKKLVSSDSLKSTTPCYVCVYVPKVVSQPKQKSKKSIRFDAYFFGPLPTPNEKCA